MVTNQSDTVSLLYPKVCQDWGSLDTPIKRRLAVCELPLAQWIYERQQGAERALLVGINGPQGCGKSTTVVSLKSLLEQYYGLRVAIVSIDDFYLTRATRRSLAESVHPLLITRGVPGTHDVSLAMDILEKLRSPGSHASLPVPHFNKAVDDRFPESAWPVFRRPVDVVLFEGWCVGATPQPAEALQTPLNNLEQTEDAAGVWRRYVNDALATGYRELFAMLDALMLFSCGDFSWVYDWRKQQELENARRAEARGSATTAIMNDAQLKRFVLHYERITRHCQASLPGLADVVVPLSKSREVSALRWRQVE